MPELVEVENYRRLLLPLCSRDPISIERPSPTPPKVFVTDEDVTWLEKSRVRDVERKGKLLRLVMQPLEAMEKDSEGNI